MAKNDGARRSEKKNKADTTQSPSPSERLEVAASDVAAVVVDLWKIIARAKQEQATDRLMAACDRADDRLKRLGFEWQDLAGQAYETGMKVSVMDHDGVGEPRMISQCLSPAVYFNGQLIRSAEVITKGIEDIDG